MKEYFIQKLRYFNLLPYHFEPNESSNELEKTTKLKTKLLSLNL